MTDLKTGPSPLVATTSIASGLAASSTGVGLFRSGESRRRSSAAGAEGRADAAANPVLTPTAAAEVELTTANPANVRG